jgi:peptidyl-prolyl cis-trans isomerase D
MDATDKDFNTLQRMGLTVVPGITVQAMDENFGPLGVQFVRWAFEDDSKIGTVKDLEANVGHVIARVKGIDNSGFSIYYTS